jgi:prepilin-type N-terminal cleavage/methylation domain-containing protein
VKKADKAFSLIEMLIVLTIITSLVSITVVKPIGNFYYDVAQVRNSLSYIYNSAFSMGRNIKIYYYQDSNKIEFKAGSKKILSYQLRYSNITNYPYFKNMEFKSVGTVTPTGMIVLKDRIRQHHYMRIYIGLFGSIRMEDVHY